MTTTVERVVEPHARYLGTATLYINPDGSWSVGPDPRTLTQVSYASITRIDDTTFGFTAEAVESDGKGGYVLFVSSNVDSDLIVQVSLDAQGRADAASIAALDTAALYAAEERYRIDLNDSGGFGDGPVLLQGGEVNLYMGALGQYQVGTSPTQLKTLTVAGQALDDQLLPAGWEIVQVVAAGTGYKVFAVDSHNAVFAADFDASGAFAGGAVLAGDALSAAEESFGIDINGDESLPAPVGWTAMLKDPAIRALVEADLSAGGTVRALASAGGDDMRGIEAGPAGTITYTELVRLFQSVIKSHKDAGDTPVTAAEITDLQALAARGKAVFAGNDVSPDYLSFVLSRIAEGSDANRFYQGGASQRSELGSLTVGSPLSVLERLVDKWLLGGDLPSTATGGDSASTTAKAANPVYAKSEGTLFVDGISVSDVNQGSAGDCYVIAVMGGLAAVQPTAIQAMFVDNGVIDGVHTWGVRFFDAGGRANWVTVNDMLPVASTGGTEVAYAGSASKALNGEIWVSLLEKAYVQVNTLNILFRNQTNGQNVYAAVEGGFGDPLAQFLGGKVLGYTAPGTGYGENGFINTRDVDLKTDADKVRLESELKVAMNSGKVIWIGSSANVKDAFGNSLLVAGHAHFAVDANPSDPANGDVLVYNPWGLAALPSPPGPGAGAQPFVSPAPYTLAQLVGIDGLSFMIVDGGPTGG